MVLVEVRGLRREREDDERWQDVPDAGLPVRQGRELPDEHLRFEHGEQVDDTDDGRRLGLRSDVPPERMREFFFYIVFSLLPVDVCYFFNYDSAHIILFHPPSSLVTAPVTKH